MNKKKIENLKNLTQLRKEMNLSSEEEKEIENLKIYYRSLNNLRIAKEKSGLNNEQISQRAGISRPQVSNVLNGKRNATLETLIKIASALGKTIKIELV